MIGLDVLRDFNQLLPDQFPAQVLKQQARDFFGGFWLALDLEGLLKKMALVHHPTDMF